MIRITLILADFFTICHPALDAGSIFPMYSPEYSGNNSWAEMTMRISQNINWINCFITTTIGIFQTDLYQYDDIQNFQNYLNYSF